MFLPPKASPCITIAAYLIALMAFATSANSAEPRIDYIELYNKDTVYIHFYTAASPPNRTYVLQYIDSLSLTNWSNLSTAYSVPFVVHKAIQDTPTNRARFYRLSVTTPWHEKFNRA